MADKAKKVKKVKIPVKAIPPKATPGANYRYVCPACTNTAIQTSNKMLGVEVECTHCAKLIKLDNLDNYITL